MFHELMNNPVYRTYWTVTAL